MNEETRKIKIRLEEIEIKIESIYGEMESLKKVSNQFDSAYAAFDDFKEILRQKYKIGLWAWFLFGVLVATILLFTIALNINL